MGRFTTLAEPLVDQIIETHMQRIVAAITARMEPVSIVLRGSFGRGEGSVILQDDHLHFLSDYEIDVATFSSFHRSLFAKLTRDLSGEFNMDAGVRWVRPDCFTRDRIGPFPLGAVTPTISLYEFRYGSRILYGKDFIASSPPVEPEHILLESGVRLLLNRMAESLYYMPVGDQTADNASEPYHWINKTILACAESLLLLWKQYHYSYQERGRRFAVLAGERLGFIPDGGVHLAGFVARATEFKLRPRYELYPDSVRETWQQIIPACDAVFRHLVGQVMQISFNDYPEFPEQFLRQPSEHSGFRSRTYFAAQKLYEAYRAAKVRRLPKSILYPFHASQVVYSIVPLLFLGYNHEQRDRMLAAARQSLSILGLLQPAKADPVCEWDYLRKQVTTFWKIFCY